MLLNHARTGLLALAGLGLLTLSGCVYHGHGGYRVGLGVEAGYPVYRDYYRPGYAIYPDVSVIYADRDRRYGHRHDRDFDRGRGHHRRHGDRSHGQGHDFDRGRGHHRRHGDRSRGHHRKRHH